MAEFSLRPLDFSEDRVQLLRLTLARRRPLSYRNQSIDFLRKSMDRFLYDNGLRHERVESLRKIKPIQLFPKKI